MDQRLDLREIKQPLASGSQHMGEIVHNHGGRRLEIIAVKETAAKVSSRYFVHFRGESICM
jgi:hypothetical protein